MKAGRILALTLLSAGCASLGELGGRRAGPVVYEPATLTQALDAPGPRSQHLRLIVAFEELEDTLLDLPQEYDKDWLRIAVSDPADRQVKTRNVVLRERELKAVSRLRRGDIIELWIDAVAQGEEDAEFAQEGSKDPVLRVKRLEKGRRASRVPTGGHAGLYRDANDRDSYVRLASDGTFSIRDRGKEISGYYRLDGSRLEFLLPSGASAKGKLSGDALVDPAGKEWTLAEPESAQRDRP